jgi:hypothetical protein
MKSILILYLSILLFSSCKKTHSCVCTVTTILAQTVTPANGEASTQESNTTVDHQKTTFNRVRKRDVNQLMDCESRSLTHNINYQAVIENQGLSDVTETSTSSYQCAVK